MLICLINRLKLLNDISLNSFILLFLLLLQINQSRHFIRQIVKLIFQSFNFCFGKSLKLSHKRRVSQRNEIVLFMTHDAQWTHRSQTIFSLQKNFYLFPVCTGHCYASFFGFFPGVEEAESTSKTKKFLDKSFDWSWFLDSVEWAL